jgi:hypothetical protein
MYRNDKTPVHHRGEQLMSLRTLVSQSLAAALLPPLHADRLRRRPTKPPPYRGRCIVITTAWCIVSASSTITGRAMSASHNPCISQPAAAVAPATSRRNPCMNRAAEAVAPATSRRNPCMNRAAAAAASPSPHTVLAGGALTAGAATVLAGAATDTARAILARAGATDTAGAGAGVAVITPPSGDLVNGRGRCRGLIVP